MLVFVNVDSCEWTSSAGSMCAGGVTYKRDDGESRNRPYIYALNVAAHVRCQCACLPIAILSSASL